MAGPCSDCYAIRASFLEIVPVVFCPLALAQTGLLPSKRGMLSAFGPVARTYLLSTIIHFSRLNTVACVLAFLCFVHHLSLVALRFGCQPGG